MVFWADPRIFDVPIDVGSWEAHRGRLLPLADDADDNTVSGRHNASWIPSPLLCFPIGPCLLSLLSSLRTITLSIFYACVAIFGFDNLCARAIQVLKTNLFLPIT